MPIQRRLWNSFITQTKAPPWPCPTCTSGKLELEKETLHFSESYASREMHNEPEWEPEWIEGRFSCLLYCNNPACKEVIAVSGKQGIEWSPIDKDPFRYETYFKPEFMSPAPHIFLIPEKTPSIVKNEILKAFELFWVDIQASANRIRSSLELLLTIKKIKRYELTSRGRKAITLHRRIELFRAKEADLADSLMAVKWLGNAGSHASPLSQDDLFDGFDILQHILEKMFDDKTKFINKLRSEINKRKGPRKSP